ncbi:hypothetical protein D9M71_604480 [compost metagenome]
MCEDVRVDICRIATWTKCLQQLFQLLSARPITFNDGVTTKVRNVVERCADLFVCNRFDTIGGLFYCFVCFPDCWVVIYFSDVEHRQRCYIRGQVHRTFVIQPVSCFDCQPSQMLWVSFFVGIIVNTPNDFVQVGDE